MLPTCLPDDTPSYTYIYMSCVYLVGIYVYPERSTPLDPRSRGPPGPTYLSQSNSRCGGWKERRGGGAKPCTQESSSLDKPTGNLFPSSSRINVEPANLSIGLASPPTLSSPSQTFRTASLIDPEEETTHTHTRLITLVTLPTMFPTSLEPQIAPPTIRILPR